MKILMVDDNDIYGLVFSKICEKYVKFFIEIEQVLSIEQAMEMLVNSKYDIIFCDIVFYSTPLTGIDLLKFIEEKKVYINSTIVLSTSSNLSYSKELNALVYDVLQLRKPFLLEDLLLILKQVNNNLKMYG